MSTNTLPREDFERTFLYSWAVQCLHCHGLTQYMAMMLYDISGCAYRAFYEGLINYATENPDTLVGQQLKFVADIVHTATEGGEWGVGLPRFGNVMWPTEEAIFLNLISEKKRLYQELAEFVAQLISDHRLDLTDDLAKDLMTYQQHSVIDPFSPEQLDFDLEFDLHGYFQSYDQDLKMPITRKPCRMTAKAEMIFDGDLEGYARHVVWYGRKGHKLRQAKIKNAENMAIYA